MCTDPAYSSEGEAQSKSLNRTNEDPDHKSNNLSPTSLCHISLRRHCAADHPYYPRH